MDRLQQANSTLAGLPSADEEAIAAVIHADTLAFQQEDFDAWADLWVHDARARDVSISNTAGLSVVSGWTEIAANMKRVFDLGMSCKLVDFGQTNMQITISGDTAWAVFDSWSDFGNGERGECFETRVLERQGGRWKFIYSSFVLNHRDGPDGIVVGLDSTGQIINSGPLTLDALNDHPILTVSAGRLRAHRRDWDRALQQAIAEAGRHHGFFETMKHANDLGGLPQYPVVLGQSDDGGVAVVHFAIRDCATYVRLNADEVLDRRLNYAKMVFGLSDGQLRVARQIALGESLKGAAQNLGIATNTARTHLARLFEKTGVNNQPALVRLLLSVG